MNKNKTPEEHMADAMLREQRNKSRPTKLFIGGFLGYLAGAILGRLLNPNPILSPGFGWSGSWWAADIWSIIGGIVGVVVGVWILKIYFRHQDSK